MPDIRRYGPAVSALIFAAFTLFGENGEEVLRRFGTAVLKQKNVSASFTQTRKIPFVRQEIKLQGVIHQEFAGRLIWKVNSPVRCAFLAEKERCFYWDEETGKVVVLEIKDNPVMRSMMTTMKMVLAGKVSAADYGFSAGKTGKNSVRLIPREGSLTSGFIREILLMFNQDFSIVEKVMVREKNGSETLTVFSNTKVNTFIPESEWKLQ